MKPTHPLASLPQLAPPGAGLPKPELFVGRLLFALRCAVTSRAAAGAKIVAERAAIKALVRPLAPADAARRVLIARPRGLEDSSRHWSVFMTVDHLRIVNLSIAATIRELVAGREPGGVVSTAAVKPSPTADAHVMPAFADSCAALLEAGCEAASLRTRLRHAHPWFGPLDAADWRVLGGMHLGMHRRQINLILAGLARERTAGKPAR